MAHSSIGVAVCRAGARAFAMALLTTVGAAAPAGAQSTNQPRPTAAVLRDVDARLAQQDSLGALAVLDSALARDRKNGTLWNRYGKIAWSMSKYESGAWMRQDLIRLRMRSDSAFRYATAFAPDSAEYFLDLGRYALETNIITVRQGARGNFEDGIKVAQAQGRQNLSSPMLDGVGMFYWRAYDDVNHRALTKAPELIVDNDVPTRPLTTAFESNVKGEATAMLVRPVATRETAYRDDYGFFYRDRLSHVKPVTGEEQYVRAREKFTEALAADATNAKARQHLFMALADHGVWQELLREAERALRADGEDISAWLARGIAASGLQDYDNAGNAFDQALRRMPDDERASFTDVRRIMAPSSNGRRSRFADTAQWNRLSGSERRRQEALFWNLADPRSSTRVNEAQVEFYSRVAYADLRFGSDEYRIRGADSDRGRIWIRYGPPSDIFSIPAGGTVEIIWVYDRPSVAFVFVLRPSFGTAYHAFADLAADSIETDNPIGWGNMPLARRTWPMRMRAARFRSSNDSMDVVVTATVPVRSFLEGAELNGALPINVQLDVHDPAARIVGREMRNVTVRMDSLPVGINGAWVRRLGRGNNVVRVDAEQPDANRAASNAIDALIDTTSGFGISDLLLGTNPKRMDATEPKRWSDISVAPTTGVFPWSQSMGVVWEVYDLVPVDGSVKYRVNLHLERTFKNNLKGFIARIGAYSKNIIERNGSGTGSITVSYEQTRPASSIVADYLSVNLNGSVPGTYRLSIEVEDLASKRVTKRTAPFILVKD